GLRAVVVGKGPLDPALVPDRSELGDRPLLVRSLTKRLEPLFLRPGSTVVTTAALDPRRVRGYALTELNERLRIAFTRLGRGDPLVRPAGPFALLHDLAPPRAGPRGVGALELAAVTALAVVAWQATSTGGLDPDRVASSGGDPVLLLVPALAFFATGVLILRLLPPALRACARLARGAP